MSYTAKERLGLSPVKMDENEAHYILSKLSSLLYEINLCMIDLHNDPDPGLGGKNKPTFFEYLATTTNELKSSIYQDAKMTVEMMKSLNDLCTEYNILS